MKRLNKLFITLASIFSVFAILPLSACNGQTYTLTMVNENEAGGSLIGEGEYKPGSDVTLSYIANNGYKFDKWNVDGEEIKTQFKTYTFKMPKKDITVTGNFVPATYTVDITSDSAVAEFTGAGTYEYNSEVTVTCSPKPGYYFLGWYKENKDGLSGCLCATTSYTFLMPSENIRLKVSLVYMS